MRLSICQQYATARRNIRSAPVLGPSRPRPAPHAEMRQAPTVCERCCARGRCSLHTSSGVEQRAGGSPPSPPLEERAGERRPIVEAANRGDVPTGCGSNGFGALVKNDDLLSLPLSSKGGEGNGAATSEHRDACRKQRGRAYSCRSRLWYRRCTRDVPRQIPAPALVCTLNRHCQSPAAPIR